MQNYDPRWLMLGSFASIINLENIEYREYQAEIAKSIFKGRNTLVVLPTGLGKTFIGVLAIAKTLYDGKKAMLLAPTKPLTEQHYSTLKSLLKVGEDEILLLTGMISRKQRSEREANARVIVATPQTVANDLKKGIFSLADFGMVIFDECHKAVGKYAYTYIANEAMERGIEIVGLTASPGGKKERINALIDALGIKNIEVRISTDPDVVNYVMPKYVHIINVPKSQTITDISKLIAPLIEASLESLRKMGLVMARRFENLPKGRLIEIGNEISKISARNYRFAAIFSYVKLLNLIHAYDLLETEGLHAFLQYFETLEEREKKSKAIEYILNNRDVVEARRRAREAIERGEEHPKMHLLVEILKSYPTKSTIVFAQYRSTIKAIVEMLGSNGFSARAFVGKKEGITQEQQKQTIADFRDSKFNVLVATSIGEEGLDIPSVDLVVFYEPIPNEIRNIQRRGRTGRFRAGDIYILVTRETKDEVYLFVSRHRERKMLAILNEMKLDLARVSKLGGGLERGQRRLDEEIKRDVKDI